MGKDYSGLATTCQLTAMVGIPLLLYFGYLGFTNSKLLELPVDKKPNAAFGCWGAAAMYVVTFVLCSVYKSTRTVEQQADPNKYVH